MREAVVVAYGRAPVTRSRKGGLAFTHPVEYGAQVLKGVLARVPQLKAEEIEDVIMGCAFPREQTALNIARLIVNRAELPDSVCGMTINRFCSSGLQSIATAANAIACGQGDVMVAGGIEDMTDTFRGGEHLPEWQDQWLNDNYPGAYMAMGLTAENVAEKYNLTREELDAFAVESHKKAAAAQAAGKLAPSIIPVEYVDAEGNKQIFDQDQGIRANSTVETLGEMKPCFKADGIVTAATSSQTDDCVAYVVLMSAEKAAEKGIKPIARLKNFAVAGCNAEYMGLGPIYAAPKALERAGLKMDDMDTIEINEAFVAQSIPCIRELKMDMAKVNPYGGATALGHPLGCTGAILVGKVIDRLQEIGGKYGLVTMCIGGGMGAAGVIEML